MMTKRNQGMAVVELGIKLADVSAKAAVKGVKAATRTVRKWNNYRPARYKLLDCPGADEVLKQWRHTRQGRSALEALRFGAMLLNVSQDVDCSPIYGRGKHIVARNPGLKGWLRENTSEITYVTAMTYRKLAEITCKAIHLPEFMPLEWVLPGTEALDETRELNPENKLSIKLKRRELLRQIRECRGELKKLLDGASNMNQLFAKLDAITHERRHRVYVKIMDKPSTGAAERDVGRHLQAALQTVRAMDPNDSLENIKALIFILSDLRKQLDAHTA
jgi:uncharacterized protein YjiS (DUF1127 family)